MPISSLCTLSRISRLTDPVNWFKICRHKQSHQVPLIEMIRKALCVCVFYSLIAHRPITPVVIWYIERLTIYYLPNIDAMLLLCSVTITVVLYMHWCIRGVVPLTSATTHLSNSFCLQVTAIYH